MRKIAVLSLLALLAMGCKKHSSPPSPPSAATLLFPDNNAACITGTVISDTKNTVPLSWHSSANTTSYEIDIKNLLTDSVSKYTSATPGLTVTLLRNAPYSWYVISKSNIGTATSDTWKFYNSGPGVVSHAPFPPQLISPTYAQVIPSTHSTITLTWDCSDVDNDIAGYDVYFGTDANPPLFESSITAKTADVNVSGGNTYYWKIVAKDSTGNTSTSLLYQFTIN